MKYFKIDYYRNKPDILDECFIQSFIFPAENIDNAISIFREFYADGRIEISGSIIDSNPSTEKELYLYKKTIERIRSNMNCELPSMNRFVNSVQSTLRDLSGELKKCEQES